MDGVTDDMKIAREETFGPVVPVSTILSAYLTTPGEGTGLYLREGFRAGERRVVPVALERTNDMDCLALS